MFHFFKGPFSICMEVTVDVNFDNIQGILEDRQFLQQSEREAIIF